MRGQRGKGGNFLHALAFAGRSGGLVLVPLALYVLDGSLRVLVSVWGAPVVRVNGGFLDDLVATGGHPNPPHTP